MKNKQLIFVNQNLIFIGLIKYTTPVSYYPHLVYIREKNGLNTRDKNYYFFYY